MTALTVDVIRIFEAVVVVVAITTIAVVITLYTADVDSMADPTPRPGEDDDEDGWPRVPDEQMRIIDAAPAQGTGMGPVGPVQGGREAMSDYLRKERRW